MTRRLISIAVLTVVLVTGLVGMVFASGTIYYGPEGSNYRRCTYCRTYSRAMSTACILSDANTDIYYVYHANDGYAGSCDMTGGSGSEPRPREGGIPRAFGAMLWPTIFMAVAGFILGMTRPPGIRRKNEPQQ